MVYPLELGSVQTKAKFNNCFIIYSKYFQALKGENELFVFLLTKNDTTLSPVLGFSINRSKPCSVKLLRVLIFLNFAD